MSDIPKTQKAILIKDQANASIVTDAPVPELRDYYVLVKTTAVSLNPTDWKHIAFNLSTPGSVVGCDYAGKVIAVGKGVTKDFKAGDRIAGFAHGSNASNKQDGTFAEYIVVKGDLQLKVPDFLSDEDASTLGVGVSTVGQGLFQSLGLDLPSENATVGDGSKGTILIYGGSTATGTLGIQFAKLAGYKVITTCSPRNFDLVKSLGADTVYDYNDAAAPAQIREYTDDKLTVAWDTISLEDSAKFCAEALSSKSGTARYSSLLSVAFPRDDVKSESTLAYTILGEPFKKMGHDFPGFPDRLEFGKKWWALAEKLIADKKIKPHPAQVGKGFEGVLEGLQYMKEGKVSGVKLTYTI